MTETDMPSVREEYFENTATGVEAEEQDYDLKEPWDPEKIRVSTKNFSLRNIIDFIADDDIELAPDFQRNKVWKPQQKSRLIESLLLQIPLPAFYFAERKDGAYSVVDGLQRLSTIQDFARGGFILKDLEYLKDEAEGKNFDDLSTQWKRRIYNTQIVVHVIDPTTPTRVTYDIFKRINTGGSPLKPQEIRHCMSQQRSRDFLKICTELPEFAATTGGSLAGTLRMDDRELALRFSAFRLLGVDGYFDGRRSMETFLMDATDMLDDPGTVSDRSLTQLKDDFRAAMDNATAIFGDHAFRKWPITAEKRNPINKPLFESWSVALATPDGQLTGTRKSRIVDEAREAMTTDIRYLNAISIGTGDPEKVRYRFEVAARIVEAR